MIPSLFCRTALGLRLVQMYVNGYFEKKGHPRNCTSICVLSFIETDDEFVAPMLPKNKTDYGKLFFNDTITYLLIKKSQKLKKIW